MHLRLSFNAAKVPHTFETSYKYRKIKALTNHANAMQRILRYMHIRYNVYFIIFKINI